MPGSRKAYKKLLQGLPGKVNVYDYYDKNDFKELWGINNSSAKAIIIVWDGSDGFCAKDKNRTLLLPHLTPMDWALAFSIKQFSDNDNKSPKPTIHIVDLTGKEHTEWSMQMRHQLLAEMPWVSLYTVAVPPDDKGVPLPFRRGYREILGFKGTDKTLLCFKSGGPAFRQNILTPQKWANGSQGRLKDLSSQWSAALTRSDDHHDINNVIGARFLLSNGGYGSVLANAFHKRMEWSEFETRKPRTLSQSQQRKLGDFNLPDLGIVVIDDHVHSGWGNVVTQWFPKCKVSCHTDEDVIDRLIGFLEGFSRKNRWNKRDFSLKLIDQIKEPQNNPEMEIILLDLRLPALANDAKKIERLYTLARSADESTSRVWREFDADELNRIRNSTNNIEALLLLPRLLSLALPLTPIVLFSATGQARIREKLKPYRNIMTSFEKPRPLNDPESVECSTTNLADCVIKGLEMQRLRLQLARVQSIQNDIEENRNIIQNNNEYRIEIYADESGAYNYGEQDNFGITSALAVCIYPPASADTLHDQLKNTAVGGDTGLGCRNANTFIRLRDSHNFRLRTPRNEQAIVVKKGDSAGSNDVINFKQVLVGINIDCDHWYVVSTKSEIPEGVQQGFEEASLAIFPDTVLDDAIKFNLEFTLFVLIPYLFREFNGKVHIYLPTRNMRLPDGVIQGTFQQCFGLDEFTRDGGDFVNTWSIDTGFPLVRGWLSQWQFVGGASIHECIEQLLVFTLVTNAEIVGGHGNREGVWFAPYFQGGAILPRREPKLLHNLADWAAYASHATVQGQPLKRALQHENIFPAGNWFVESRESMFKDSERLMDALRIEYSRPSGKSISPNALRLILQSACVMSGSFNKQQELILWRMKDQLEKAKGEDLHRVLYS